MKELKNYAELLEQLTNILLQFEKDQNNYEIDIYLHYDEQEKTGTLDTFVNPGGNSWRNDDHYCIGRDPDNEFTEGCRMRAECMLSVWMILDEELEFLRR